MVVAGSKRNSRSLMLAGLGVAALGRGAGAIGGALVGGVAGRALAVRVVKPHATAGNQATKFRRPSTSAMVGGVSGAIVGHRIGGVLGSLAAIPATVLVVRRGGDRHAVRTMFETVHHGVAAAGAVAGAHAGYRLGAKNKKVSAALATAAGASLSLSAYDLYKKYKRPYVFGARPTYSYKATHGAHARNFAGSFPSSKGMKGAAYRLYRSVVGKTNRAFGRADRMLGG